MLKGCRDVTNSSIVTSNSSAPNSSSVSCCKTPSQDRSSLCSKLTGKTPGSAGRAVKKTPNSKSRNLTPSRNPNATKTPNGGDRFIPNRSATQFELGHYLIFNQSQNESQANIPNVVISPAKLEFQRAMSDQLNGGVTAPPDSEAIDPNSSTRILAFQKKPPLAPRGYANTQKVIYGARATPASSCKKSVRHIPSNPDRILDAPEIMDDYYLNLLDWSCSNLLAVALAGHVYLWNAGTGAIQQLCEMSGQEDYVSSINFNADGCYLALGTSTCDVQLWDVVQNRRLRSMEGHAARVGSLSWNSHILSSGSRDGSIYHHDVRVPNHLIAQLAGHTQDVCGLKWSPDGRYLASGGNDNLLQIWQQSDTSTDTTPLYTLTDHQAAVKAVSWCPWQPSILASGGGTADRNIRMWNINTGAGLASVDTSSQVCSILWSNEYKELISGHGFPSHQLTIWKYPKMTKVQELLGHTSRVLHMAMSPDGQMVVSASADESLRIWNCFAQDAEKKKAEQRVKLRVDNSTGGNIARSIR